MDSADIADYYVTPYDIGYGRTVKFDHDFLGREALEHLAAEEASQAAGAPGRRQPWCGDPDDLALAVRSLCEPGTPAKYIEMPKARYAFFGVDKVLRNGLTAGMSLDLGYIANEHAFVPRNGRRRGRQAEHGGHGAVGRAAEHRQARRRAAPAGRHPGDLQSPRRRRPGGPGTPTARARRRSRARGGRPGSPRIRSATRVWFPAAAAAAVVPGGSRPSRTATRAAWVREVSSQLAQLGD